MNALAPVASCVLALGLLIPAASADTITFTGAGSAFPTRYNFTISGDDFLYRISNPEGPYSIGNCTAPGVPCAFQAAYTAGVLPAPERIGVFASLGNVSTTLVSGRLVFLGTVTPPTPLGDFQATIPIAFAGEIIGHYGTPPGGTRSPVAFDVVLGGPGTADLGGFVTPDAQVVINTATYKFSGTGLTESEVPEPGAVFLAAGGIGLLALFLRRRRKVWG